MKEKADRSEAAIDSRICNDDRHRQETIGVFRQKARRIETPIIGINELRPKPFGGRSIADKRENEDEWIDPECHDRCIVGVSAHHYSRKENSRQRLIGRQRPEGAHDDVRG